MKITIDACIRREFVSAGWWGTPFSVVGVRASHSNTHNVYTHSQANTCTHLQTHRQANIQAHTLTITHIFAFPAKWGYTIPTQKSIGMIMPYTLKDKL